MSIYSEIYFAFYCHTGPGSTVAPQTAAPNTQCVDKLNCQEYGQYVCKQPYLDWAQANCRKYCNFCRKSLIYSVTSFIEVERINDFTLKYQSI
jgi:hypothetical protein